jgi:hypothetical protein
MPGETNKTKTSTGIKDDFDGSGLQQSGDAGHFAPSTSSETSWSDYSIQEAAANLGSNRCTHTGLAWYRRMA